MRFIHEICRPMGQYRLVDAKEALALIGCKFCWGGAAISLIGARMMSGGAQWFDMDLDEDTRSFRESVRSFADRIVAPKAEEIDRTNAFPKDVDLWKEMGDMGLHGITIPEHHGGLGLGYLHHW